MLTCFGRAKRMTERAAERLPAAGRRARARRQPSPRTSRRSPRDLDRAGAASTARCTRSRSRPPTRSAATSSARRAESAQTAFARARARCKAPRRGARAADAGRRQRGRAGLRRLAWPGRSTTGWASPRRRSRRSPATWRATSARSGIRVNLVSRRPARRRSPRAASPASTALAEALARARRRSAGTPSDPGPVADAICFLLSDLARAITGEILHVDGGFSAIGARPGAAPPPPRCPRRWRVSTVLLTGGDRLPRHGGPRPAARATDREVVALVRAADPAGAPRPALRRCSSASAPRSTRAACARSRATSRARARAHRRRARRARGADRRHRALRGVRRRSPCRSTRRARSTSRARAGCSTWPQRRRPSLERFVHVSTAYVAGTHAGRVRRGRPRRRPGLPQHLRADQARGRAARARARRPAARRRRGRASSWARAPRAGRARSTSLYSAAAGVRARAASARARPTPTRSSTSSRSTTSPTASSRRSTRRSRRTYHLVAGESARRVRELAELAGRYFDRPAPELIPPHEFDQNSPVLEQMEVYFPYFSVCARFDDAHARDQVAPRPRRWRATSTASWTSPSRHGGQAGTAARAARRELTGRPSADGRP